MDSESTSAPVGLAAAERLLALLAGMTDADRLTEAGEWIVDCDTTADFLAPREPRGLVTPAASIPVHPGTPGP